MSDVSQSATVVSKVSPKSSSLASTKGRFVSRGGKLVSRTKKQPAPRLDPMAVLLHLELLDQLHDMAYKLVDHCTGERRMSRKRYAQFEGMFIKGSEVLERFIKETAWNPETQALFDDLLDPEDSEAYLRPEWSMNTAFGCCPEETLSILVDVAFILTNETIRSAREVKAA